jgi:hypothetical protein
MNEKLPSGLMSYLAKRHIPLNFTKARDSYSILMYSLYKKGVFSELHIPAQTLLMENSDMTYTIKIVPRKFWDYETDLIELSKQGCTFLPNIEGAYTQGNEKYILSKSPTGKIKRSLTPSEKEKAIEAFFKLHRKIRNARLSKSYFNVVNEKKFIGDRDLIIRKISSKKKNAFDRQVLAHLESCESIRKRIPKRLMAGFSLAPVHGDFKIHNLVWRKGEIIQAIDPDMCHEGILALQYTRLLVELHYFGSAQFWRKLRKYCKAEDISIADLYPLYVYHEMFNIAAIKLVYYCTGIDSLRLQSHAASKIRRVERLISNYQKFESELNKLE